MARLPLHGVRILDFTVVWAGPFATMTLGEMGAEVIRVESLVRADTVTRGSVRPAPQVLEQPRGAYWTDRDPGRRPWNRYGYFNYSGRHKYSMSADLSRPEGQAVARRLVSLSDVIVENNRVTTMAKLGLAYDEARKVRPDIIYISMPAFGTTGPYSKFRGFGANTEAVVGHTWLRGYPDADPSLTYVIYHSDAAAGASAAFAVISALHYRRRTGQGQFIDMSQSENMVHHLAQPFMDYSMNRRPQSSLGNRDVSMAPQGSYPCRGEDEWIAISVRSDGEWAALAKVIRQPGLASDSRYRSALARVRNHDDLDQILANWTRAQDKYEAMRILQAAGVPAGAVIPYMGAHYDPHLTERGFFELVAEPEAGVHLQPGRGYRFRNQPLHVRHPAPTLGGQNDYLYRDLLGYGESDIEHFVAEGHVGLDYAESVLA